jgi:hypothetical protein
VGHYWEKHPQSSQCHTAGHSQGFDPHFETPSKELLIASVAHAPVADSYFPIDDTTSKRVANLSPRFLF